jgi:hypothetical protein
LKNKASGYPIRKQHYTSLNMAATPSNTKYMDLVQTNPDEFNANQRKKQEEYTEKHGDHKAREDIWWSKKHHPLKSSRSVDYRLTEEETKKLYKDGFLILPSAEETFMGFYEKLYNNDMPVAITSDMMLHAVHKFYDSYIKFLEETKLSNELCKLSEQLNVINDISSDDPNTIKILSDLELFLSMPAVILNLKHDLTKEYPTLSFENTVAIDKKDLVFPDFTGIDVPTDNQYEKHIKCIKDLKDKYYDKEITDGYSYVDYNSCIGSYKDYKTGELTMTFDCMTADGSKFSNKFEKFCEHYDIIGDADRGTKLLLLILSCPKYNTYFQKFAISNVNYKPKFKYAKIEQIDPLFREIISEGDFIFSNQTIVGSMFKPRGHYTDSEKLKKYFIAFMWMSQLKFNLVKPKGEFGYDTFVDNIAKVSVVSKVLENIPGFQLFTDFIQNIIGTPRTYSVLTWNLFINEYLPKCDSLSEVLNWVVKNKFDLTKVVEDKLEYKQFCLISKGSSIDHKVIDKMVDYEHILDNGKPSLRKFFTIFDLVYTVFDNKEVKPLIDNASSYKYDNHLESVSKMCDKYKFTDCIYDQELKMLRALSIDEKKWWPFNTKAYALKLANTQIGHYAEVRHDNVLYVEENMGCGIECLHPDLLVEPLPTFWREMLNLIYKLKKFISKDEYKTKYEKYSDELTNFEKFNDILDRFENVLKNIIEYLDFQLNEKPAPEELTEKLKAIVNIEHGGSGGPICSGWYYDLFYERYDDIFNFKPEVCSIFTAPDDDRGPGGIHHLGTGKVQTLYVLSCDPVTKEYKVFIGGTYSSYEVFTDYETRYSDKDWASVLDTKKPLKF